jgi:hypothetical protein
MHAARVFNLIARRPYEIFGLDIEKIEDYQYQLMSAEVLTEAMNGTQPVAAWALVVWR